MKEKLKQLLAQRPKRRITDASRIPSAVLLPLYQESGQYHLLFIKRTQTVKDHKGEVSFPGGTREEGETLRETALRECTEEIGLNAGDVEILGELDDEITATSNYIVSTFVAAIPWPYQFSINKEEVEEIIGIPISALLDTNCRQPDRRLADDGGRDFHIYHCRGRVIWGATARILDRFLDIFRRAMRDGAIQK